MIQLEIQNPYSKAEILSSINDVSEKVSSFFNSLGPGLFFNTELGGWSPAENLSHLNFITSLSVNLLKFPRFLLIPFGKRKEQKDFKTLHDEYIYSTKKIPLGPLAPSRINPPPPAGAEEKIQTMISDWKNTCRGLIKVLENIPEKDFDSYSIPHPSLGMLSFREMMYVLIIHAIHHSYKVEQKINN